MSPEYNDFADRNATAWNVGKSIHHAVLASPPAVRQALQRLHENTSTLEEELGRLLSRIEPVLSPLAPEPCDDSRGGTGSAAPALPPMAAEINQLAIRIGDMTRRARSAIDTLGI